MQFTAELKRYTATWKLWRQHHRVGGEIGGVKFAWVAGDRYVTGALNTTQVQSVSRAPDVVLLVTGAPVSVPAVELPVEQVESVRIVKTGQPLDIEPGVTVPRGKPMSRTGAR